MGTQKKTASRRAHCSIDNLPEELQIAVRLMVVNYAWPGDYKGRCEGTPRYQNAVQYCKSKGFVVSRSAIGRFAKRIRAASAQRIISDLQPYTLAHLGEICSEFASIQEELLESRVHPKRTPMSAERKSLLERLASEQLGYIERTIRALRIVGYK